MISRTQSEIMSEWKGDVNKPLVSINCITYNHESYVADALEGFLIQQTNFPFDILVDDDASTDKTADIIREYEKKFPAIIKAICQIENQVSKGKDVLRINSERSKGKYIAICEGDDFWTDPQKLQIQVDWLESHSDYSMCFHAAEVKFEGQLYTEAEHDSIQDKDYTAKDVLNRWLVPTAAMVMKRECALIPYKNPKDIFAGDIFLCFACLSMGKIRGINRVMSVYRVTLGGVTHNPAFKERTIMKMPNHYECLKENFPFAPLHQINKILAFYYWQRAGHQSTLKLSIEDRKKAFIAAPLVAFLMIFRPLVMLVVKVLSVFFDENKIRVFIKKMTTRI